MRRTQPDDPSKPSRSADDSPVHGAMRIGPCSVNNNLRIVIEPDGTAADNERDKPVALRLRLRNAGFYRKCKPRRLLRNDDPRSNVAKQQRWETDGSDETDETYKGWVSS